MTWMHRIRLKVLAFAVGIALAALGLISLTTVPVWPVVGIAVAAVAFTINTVASRLTTGSTTCYGCGQTLVGAPEGEHGCICPGCGAINQRLAAVNAEPEDEHLA
jgi:hypothetical protein